MFFAFSSSPGVLEFVGHLGWTWMGSKPFHAAAGSSGGAGFTQLELGSQRLKMQSSISPGEFPGQVSIVRNRCSN